MRRRAGDSELQPHHALVAVNRSAQRWLGDYQLVEGLEIDAFSQECINKTLKELQDEQSGVAHLL